MRRILLPLVVLIGCAHVPPKPEWVLQGSGVFETPQRCLRGVSYATGERPEPVRIKAATILATASVAKILDLFSASLLDKADPSLTDALRAFIAHQFKRIQVAGQWSEDTHTSYVMMELAFDPFRDDFLKWTKMDEAQRAGLIAKLDAMFEELASRNRKPATR